MFHFRHIIILIFCFSTNVFASNSIKVEDAWIPEMPPGSRVMGGYLKFKNESNQPLIITEISSPSFSSVEMHLSKHVDGMARMIPQLHLHIDAKSTLVLEPGSFHLMLFNPKKRYKSGDKIEFTAKLNNGEAINFYSEVKKRDNMSNDHHQHHH